MPIPPGPTPPAGSEVSTPSANLGTSGSNDNSDSPVRYAGALAAGDSLDVSASPAIVQYAQDIYATNYQVSDRLVAATGVATSSFTVEFAPCILIIDATNGNVTVNLPSPRALSGKTITMMRADNTAGRTITISATEGNVRTTTSVAAILGTQYGAVDFTASAHLDSAGTGVELVWIGR